MKNVNFVDYAVFFMKDGKVAVSFNLEDVKVLADRAFYDGANTLVLSGVDGVLYVVQNIVPEVRIVLDRQTEIMVILQEKNNIVASYELSLQRLSGVSFEDTFVEEAQKLCEELEALVSA